MSNDLEKEVKKLKMEVNRLKNGKAEKEKSGCGTRIGWALQYAIGGVVVSVLFYHFGLLDKLGIADTG